MSIVTTLRKAIKLQEKIEVLRGQLAGMIEAARSEIAASPVEEIPTAIRGVARPKTLGGRRATAGGSKPLRYSPLAGRKRAVSPSGPLSPAVVKVLRSNGRAMNVHDILTGLTANGYKFNSAEPKKNLAARIYRLSGVKQTGPGLFNVI